MRFLEQRLLTAFSPPLSQSACSVVSYKKLADVNNGGAGSIFEVFEYSTAGTPYSKAKITSGYAIIKQMGELIFRTTAHQEDVQGTLSIFANLMFKFQFTSSILDRSTAKANMTMWVCFKNRGTILLVFRWLCPQIATIPSTYLPETQSSTNNDMRPLSCNCLSKRAL